VAGHRCLAHMYNNNNMHGVYICTCHMYMYTHACCHMYMYTHACNRDARR
jgi:hypothetical protein